MPEQRRTPSDGPGGGTAGPLVRGSRPRRAVHGASRARGVIERHLLTEFVWVGAEGAQPVLFRSRELLQ